MQKLVMNGSQMEKAFEGSIFDPRLMFEMAALIVLSATNLVASEESNNLRDIAAANPSLSKSKNTLSTDENSTARFANPRNWLQA